jgi:hypothetical protein
MMFQEVAPSENFDLRRFGSLPEGRWEAGVLKMLWGNARVRLSLAKSDSLVTLDYWGADHKTALLLLGFIIGVCIHLPESITEAELKDIFPYQNDKELGADFWNRLFKAGASARIIYGDFQE